MGPSFLEGGPIMYRCCPSVCLSVPCLHLQGKRKGLHIQNLAGRVPGTPAPLDQLQGQGVRGKGHGGYLRCLQKNPHNFAAGPIHLIFGRCRLAPNALVAMATAVPSVCPYSAARTAP